MAGDERVDARDEHRTVGGRLRLGAGGERREQEEERLKRATHGGSPRAVRSEFCARAAKPPEPRRPAANAIDDRDATVALDSVSGGRLELAPWESRPDVRVSKLHAWRAPRPRQPHRAADDHRRRDSRHFGHDHVTTRLLRPHDDARMLTTRRRVAASPALVRRVRARERRASRGRPRPRRSTRRREERPWCRDRSSRSHAVGVGIPRSRSVRDAPPAPAARWGVLHSRADEPSFDARDCRNAGNGQDRRPSSAGAAWCSSRRKRDSHCSVRTRCRVAPPATRRSRTRCRRVRAVAARHRTGVGRRRWVIS